MMVQRARDLLSTCCLALALFGVSPAEAHWSFDAELGLSHDDNLGNARSVDAQSDRAVVATIAATRTLYLDDGDSLAWGGRLGAENYARFAGLNNAALGVNAAYRKKLGIGALAPWWRASWTSSALSYGEDARNGWLHQADIAAGQRLDERVNVGLAFRLEQRRAVTQDSEVPGLSGDAFSQASRSLSLSADYAASRDWMLTLGGNLRRGDIVSTSHRYRQVFLYSKAIADDTALGADMYAYRLTGSTLAINAGVAVALSSDAQLNCNVQRWLTHADGGNNYARNVLAMSWITNF